MTAYVALLRAVNVGGTGKLPMPELKAMCEAAGFERVRTYIASGNVVFASGLSAGEAKAELERRLAAFVGKPIAVMVRTAAEMAKVVAANPFPDAKPNQLLVTFLDDAPAADALATVRHQSNERLWLGEREIWIHYGAGIGTSKLVVPAAKAGTARNLNTVAKLAAMAAELCG
jgi:uncharacterized protein (DUF1697 family)